MPAPDQFQPALYFEIVFRVLDALAHFAIDLLRTYLYIPLGGNRRGAMRTYLNIMLVMGLGGLWHGAALSYLMGLSARPAIGHRAADPESS
jgi:hypothetical protein